MRRETVYSPEAITSDDYSQGSAIFIYRDGFNGDIGVSEGKDTAEVRVNFSKLSEPAFFSKNYFYIEFDDKKFNPISPAEYISESNKPTDITSHEIHQGKVLTLEFPKEVLELDSFTLHLPSITTGNGQVVNNLDSITFNKKNKWKVSPPIN